MLVAPFARRDPIDKEPVYLLHRATGDLTDAEINIYKGDNTESGVYEAGFRAEIGRVV